jgi:predicted permease
MDTTLAVLAGLTPSVGVGLLFWFAMRKIMRADRHEREALDRMDRESMVATTENTGNSPSR